MTFKEDSKAEAIDEWAFRNCRVVWKIFHKVVDFPGNVWRQIKWFFQRLFRGYSSYDLWGLDYYMAKRILPALIAFRNSNLHGTPIAFCEYDPNWGISKEEYNKKIEDGEICGGGHEAWLKAVDEMIFALEYILYFEDTDRKGNDSKKKIAFMKKYNLEDPYAETERNKSIYYSYAAENSTTCLSDEKPEEGVEYKKRVSYYNEELAKEIDDRCSKGLELLGKNFRSLWD